MAEEGHVVSLVKLCRWLGIPRRSLYYRPKPRQRVINTDLTARVKPGPGAVPHLWLSPSGVHFRGEPQAYTTHPAVERLAGGGRRAAARAPGAYCPSRHGLMSAGQ